MGATITLYRASKVDGISRFGNFASQSEMTTYFNGLSKKTYTTNTFKLGEPFYLSAGIDDLIGYSYGKMKFDKNSLTFYFSVSDYSMITEESTEVSYEIDCYTTSLFQTNMSFGRANIHRYPSKIGKVSNPYNAFNTGYDQLTKPSDSNWGLYYIRRNSEQNIIAFGYVTGTIGSLLIGVQNPLTVVPLASTIEDIIVCGILPFKIKSSALSSYWYSTSVTAEGCTGYEIYANKGDNAILNGVSIDTSWLTSGVTIANDIQTVVTVNDVRGNKIWESQPFKEYTGITDGRINFTVSTISAILTVAGKDANGNTDYETITYPAETIDMFTDSWLTYFTNQRQTDIETRNLQMNQQLVSGLVNTASSVAMGALMGGIGGVGSVAGGAVGGASGLASALGSYAVSAYYSPKEQAITDQYYKRQPDSLSQIGNFQSGWMGNYWAGMYQYIQDKDTQDAYNNDVAINGYYVEYDTDSLSIVNGSIQGEIEILGDIPSVWKEWIYNKFANGVYMS